MTRKTLLRYRLLLALFIGTTAVAAQPASYVVHDESKLWIDGSSNRSDWTVYATEMKGTFMMDAGAQGDATIQNLRFIVPAATIVSRKSTIMDRLMMDALKVDEHPQVAFSMDEASMKKAAKQGTFSSSVTGRLQIGGVTKSITLPVAGERLPDGRVRFTGSYRMKMTDYDLKPPTALFGQLHTGDEVVVNFDVVAAKAP